jgi:hypothetical protein
MIPEGYCDEPHDFAECKPFRAHCGNPRFKPKHIGLKRGHTWDKNIPRSAYPEIVRKFESGEELAADIGRPYKVGPVAIRSLVRRCKAHPELLEGGERH